MACGRITAYDVRWRPTGSGAPWRTRRFAASDGPAITLTGLDRSVAYDVEARAIGADGQASAWVPVTVTVGGVSVVPSPPTTITTTPSPDGVTVEWDIPADNRPDTVYVVERAPGATGPWSEKGRTRGAKLYLPVEDDAAWHWRVRAETWEGTLGGYSPVVIQARDRVPRAAGDIPYADGTPVEALRPAEPGATKGAVVDDGTGTGNVTLPDGTPVSNTMLLVKDITVAQLPAQGTHDGQLLILDDPGDGIPPVWYQWDAQSNQWVKRAPANLLELDPVRGSKLDGVEAGATKSRVVVQASAPAEPTLNDLWYDTTAKRLKRWDGSAWIEVGSLNTGLLADRDDVDIAAGHLKDSGITLPADKIRNDMLVLQNDGTLKIATGTVLGRATASGLGVKALGFKDRITAISDLSADVVVGDALRKTTKVEIGSTNPIHISGNDAVWSGFRLWVGAETPQDAPFCVDSAGKAKLIAPEIYDAAGNLVFDGTKFTGLAQTQAAESAPIGINPYVVSCADDNDIKQVELTVQSSVTARATISLKNRTTAPAGSYPSTVTLTIQRRQVGGSTWTQVATATFTKTSTSPGAGQYQVSSIDLTDPEPRLGGGTITISYDVVVAENGLEVAATETVPAGMWEYRVTCSRPVGRELTLTDNTGGGFVVSGTSAQQGTGGTYLPVTGGTITGNLAVSGDLTVSGNLVTVSSRQVDIGDNIVRLNAGLPDTSAPTLDAGIEIERGNQINVKFYWDEANDRWSLSTPSGTYKVWHDGNAPATATRWPTWSEVTGKPSTFTPAAHTHSPSDISAAGTLTVERLRITTGSDLSATSTLHGFQVGSDTGANVAIDNNEIMARNNGAVSALNLNAEGGVVSLSAGALQVNNSPDRDSSHCSIRGAHSQLTLFDTDDGFFTQFSNSSQMLAVRVNTTSGTPTLTLKADKVGVFTSAPSAAFHVAGDARIDGPLDLRSDTSGTSSTDYKTLWRTSNGAFVYSGVLYNGTWFGRYYHTAWAGHHYWSANSANGTVDCLRFYVSGSTPSATKIELWDGSNWNLVWHAGNDGAGSGLDADKLDGLESSQFLRADSNATYTGGVLTLNGGMIDCTGNTTNRWYVRLNNGGGTSGLQTDANGNALLNMKAASGTTSVQLHTSGTSWLLGGNVGIGTSSPSSKLHVGGTARIDSFLECKEIRGGAASGGQQVVINAGESHSYATGQTGEAVYINAEGGLEVNSSPDNWGSGWAGRKTAILKGDLLDVQGTITGVEVTATSDESLKTNIRTITDALSTLLQLRGVKFQWKGVSGNPQGPDRIGLIAQEVQPYLPEVVHERGDGILTIDYGAVVGLLIEAIKEQQDQIDQQKARLDAIEARLAAGGL
ncbi:MAG: hypothetical protein KatS3mg119_1877 [Rhodothalassiaceae bacterium]|nr:MAG: hypothetical protein KatS3mg119_1877 [Rhodothalassiaceae bacterium]